MLRDFAYMRGDAVGDGDTEPLRVKCTGTVTRAASHRAAAFAPPSDAEPWKRTTTSNRANSGCAETHCAQHGRRSRPLK